MLREYKNVRQPPGEGRRRWFEGHALELVVWYGHDTAPVTSPDAGAAEGFQLLYRTRLGEYALTWRAGTGFESSRVDNGTMSPMKNLAPILLPHDEVPWAKLLAEFDRTSGELDPSLQMLVRERLVARK